MCLSDVTSQLYQSQVTRAKWLLCPKEQNLRGLGCPCPTGYTGHLVGLAQWGLDLLSRMDTLLAACMLCGPNHLHPFPDLNVCPGSEVLAGPGKPEPVICVFPSGPSKAL